MLLVLLRGIVTAILLLRGWTTVRGCVRGSAMAVLAILVLAVAVLSLRAAV
jgi:hypothetical protein